MSYSALFLNRLARSHPSSQAGLTLLECLMAIVVISLTAAMITPPLFLAAATRVQNRRADQAMQIAQGEIDRIQTLVARSKHIPASLPAVAGAGPNLNVRSVAPPSGAAAVMRSPASCAGYTAYRDQQIPVSQVYLVDMEGDCRPDFMVQSFRSAGTIPLAEQSGLNRPSDFTIAVRVYSNVANGNWGNLQPEQASLQLTTGRGSQRTRPLSVLQSRMYWSVNRGTLCEIQAAGGRTCS